MKSFLLLFILTTTLAKDNYSINLSKKTDSDIVIINIEEGDRSFIGNLINQVSECKPKVIGIDIFFSTTKDRHQDSVLLDAFTRTKNLVLGYSSSTKSIEYFRKEIEHEGLVELDIVNGLSSHFTPFKIINDSTHLHFASKIVQLYKPKIKQSFTPDKSIPINYTRKLSQFIHIDGSKLNYKKHRKLLKNKIVLLGYIGPTNEGKHFTPIRTVSNYNPDVPDTYGVIISANEIITILNSN